MREAGTGDDVSVIADEIWEDRSGNDNIIEWVV